MQNATKLYRTLKAIQGVILIALGIVVCVFYKDPKMADAIGYSVATVLLIFGILTVGISYIFQRGIASSDMISGVLISSVSIFVFLSPSLVLDFIPLVASVAALIYVLILIIETAISFYHKQKVRGSIYIVAAVLLLALGVTCLVLNTKPEFKQAVILLIGIFLTIAGLIHGILALVQPKQEIILQGSSLVTDANLPATTAQNNSNEKGGKKGKKEDIKAIEHKDGKKSKSSKKVENNEVSSENVKKIETKTKAIEHKGNKKATDEIDSDDVIIIEPTDKD